MAGRFRGRSITHLRSRRTAELYLAVHGNATCRLPYSYITFREHSTLQLCTPEDLLFPRWKTQHVFIPRQPLSVRSFILLPSHCLKQDLAHGVFRASRLGRRGNAGNGRNAGFADVGSLEIIARSWDNAEWMDVQSFTIQAHGLHPFGSNYSHFGNIRYNDKKIWLT